MLLKDALKTLVSVLKPKHSSAEEFLENNSCTKNEWLFSLFLLCFIHNFMLWIFGNLDTISEACLKSCLIGFEAVGSSD